MMAPSRSGLGATTGDMYALFFNFGAITGGGRLGIVQLLGELARSRTTGSQATLSGGQLMASVFPHFLLGNLYFGVTFERFLTRFACMCSRFSVFRAILRFWKTSLIF